jgi:hypothetical protein
LNVQRVNNLRQTEKHTAESLVSDPSSLSVKIAIETMIRPKSPGTDEIPAEVTQAEGETLGYETYERIKYIWNEEDLPQ